jgi:hypothetical protein
MAAATLGPLNTTATPIQEERFVTLGGIEQWITIRGANRANRDAARFASRLE